MSGRLYRVSGTFRQGSLCQRPSTHYKIQYLRLTKRNKTTSMMPNWIAINQKHHPAKPARLVSQCRGDENQSHTRQPMWLIPTPLMKGVTVIPRANAVLSTKSSVPRGRKTKSHSTHLQTAIAFALSCVKKRSLSVAGTRFKFKFSSFPKAGGKAC